MKADAQDMVSKFEGLHLSIGAKVSSTGKIFGSVGPIQIAEALEQQGLEVDRKSILLKEAVKEVGEYKATVKLHREVQVEISFEVVAE
jgi:large subunit ribosomal protein L9